MDVLDLFEKLAAWRRSDEFRAAGIYPYFRAIQSSKSGTRVVIDGREVVMAGSNNYLGLTHDPRVIEAAQKAAAEFGTGCTGSRFLNGTLTIHEELEDRLARFLGKEACITSGTGFQTNVGALVALMGREDVIFGDRDNHASIIDGCRLSFARHLKYRHNDMEDLGRLLRETMVSEKGSRLIVTDGVFSMLGDLAPLPRMVELARQHGARVMVDDAHALGVLGENGRGTPEHFGVEDGADMIVGTFSKSMACLGGFVASSYRIIEYLKHTSRSVIFSASMTPASVATVLTCLDIVEKEPERRAHLWKNVEYMKKGFEALGLDVIDGGSPILSVVIGDTIPTMEFNRLLYEQGVFVNPVMPPAVPPGMSLLRTSYMATHTQEDLDRILSAFKVVSERLRIAG
ncbi:MAG: aminotransferase class I/II-fold pyridoxal phosphate-dependent enzyme [Planctomycetota bacterium]|jgi:8-amino-7-oxononanoate synthase